MKSEIDLIIKQPLLADEKLMALIEEYREVKATYDELEILVNELKNAICDHMDLHDTLVNSDGEIMATWKYTHPRTRLDVKKLGSDHPELYLQYSVQDPPSRRFLVKQFGV